MNDLRTCIALLFIALIAACGGRAANNAPAAPGAPAGGAAGPGERARPDGNSDEEETSYADFIEGAESDDGVFTVHHRDDDYFFEIPDSLLGRDMLLISRIAGKMDGLGGFAPAGVAANRQMIRFERRGDQILLRKHSD